MNRITTELKLGRVLVSDGAWGTFLHRKGLKPGECPEEWNILRPDDVADIARSYAEAGADMVETNSFGGNRYKLERYGKADKVYEFNRAAAEISRKAVGPDRFVLGSMGPTGKLLIMEEVTDEELYEAFREQAVALEAGGADAILIETMTDLDEARMAVKAAKEHTALEVFCTLTFDKLVDGSFRTMMGVSIPDMVAVLKEAGADLVGTNCGNGMEDMVDMVREIRAVDGTLPILVHANAGKPRLVDGQTVFPESAEEMASYIPAVLEAGANIVGGCCGTTPLHIAQIYQAVRAFK
ncbi:MAG: homocysteine S-methyltransferase family protein [Marinilabiliales bacterium]|nr:homocysteine S-methyltransferase family protein [Marinilabiliales bacterium]